MNGANTVKRAEVILENNSTAIAQSQPVNQVKTINSVPEIKNEIKTESEKTESAKTAQISSGNGSWRDVINHLKSTGKMSLYATLVSAKADIGKDLVTIYFSQEFGKNVIERPENMATLKSSIMATCGAELPVKCVVEGKSNVSTNDAENTLINSGIDVNIL